MNTDQHQLNGATVYPSAEAGIPPECVCGADWLLTTGCEWVRSGGRRKAIPLVQDPDDVEAEQLRRARRDARAGRRWPWRWWR